MALSLYGRRRKSALQGLGGIRHLWVLLAVLEAVFLSHPIGAEITRGNPADSDSE